jgi:choline-sulfatase
MKPNVVFILTDDQGPWALGSAGNGEIITPALDGLAASGMRFENFFCTSPVCSPARASLITGRIPSAHGVHDWIREGNDGRAGIGYLDGQLCYTDVLADGGYRVGLSGKWHLGSSDVPRVGFEHWYAHQKGSGHYYDAPMYRDGALVHEKGYISDVITDDAIRFIESSVHDEMPFYSSVHFTAPHSPWLDGEHPAEIVDLYADCPFESCPQLPHHPEAVQRFSPKDARACLQGYFAAVTAMDRNVGRILACLDELGIRENTLVCFLSDNGFNCGHHGIWGKGNGTLNLNMYDTSVKVPAIFSLPESISSGVVSNNLVSGYDFMPTLLDFLDLDISSNIKFDIELPGKSFSPALKGIESGRNDEREEVVIFNEYGPVRMIRTSDWKYVHRFPYGNHELYDVLNDPGETVNLCGESGHEKTIRTLKQIMDEWFLRYVDPAIDGTHEPVCGNGQVSKAGVYALGACAFMQGRSVSTDPRFDPGMKKRE